MKYPMKDLMKLTAKQSTFVTMRIEEMVTNQLMFINKSFDLDEILRLSETEPNDLITKYISDLCKDILIGNHCPTILSVAFDWRESVHGYEYWAAMDRLIENEINHWLHWVDGVDYGCFTEKEKLQICIDHRNKLEEKKERMENSVSLLQETAKEMEESATSSSLESCGGLISKGAAEKINDEDSSELELL